MTANSRRLRTRIRGSFAQRYLAVGALALGFAGAAALTLPAAADATPSNLSWSGAGIGGNWSNAANWSGIAPVAGGNYGTLTLGDLGKACDRQAGDGTCYSADNDLPGLAVNRIDLDANAPYLLQGDGIALGAGGIDVTQTGEDVNEPPELTTPLTLAADQTWRISGYKSAIDIFSVGPVDGSNSLAVDLSDHGQLALDDDVEIGPLTLSGAGIAYMGGSLNSTSGNQVTVTDQSRLLAAAKQQSGPLAVTDHGDLTVGNGFPPEGTLQVDGAASFASPSSLRLFLDSPGSGHGKNSDPKVGPDYSQLTATGNVDLGGTNLGLTQGSPNGYMCVNLHAGDVYTLVKTSGTLSGTFAGIANGHELTLSTTCQGTTDNPVVRINYTASAVTATVMNGGGAADVPTPKRFPRLSGKAVVGQSLHASTGSWFHKPTSYRYEWIACSRLGKCEQIKLERPRLVLTRSLIGDRVYADVTAINRYGRTESNTNSSAAVKAAPKHR